MREDWKLFLREEVYFFYGAIFDWIFFKEILLLMLSLTLTHSKILEKCNAPIMKNSFFRIVVIFPHAPTCLCNCLEM